MSKAVWGTKVNIVDVFSYEFQTEVNETEESKIKRGKQTLRMKECGEEEQLPSH